MRLSGLPCGGEGGGPKFSDSDFGQQESAGIVEQRRVIALVSRVPCLRNFLSLAHVCKASECCADPGEEATKPKTRISETYGQEGRRHRGRGPRGRAPAQCDVPH